MLEPGFVLQDRYVIESLIGEGGMACVYAAHDRQLPGNRVAVKEMRLFLDNAAERPAAIEQFQREAQVLRQLKNEHLPRVYAWFEQQGSYYLVMDLIDGRTLAQVEHPTVDAVLDWAAQIADALAYLHAQSPPVIYKDLKPDNVMLTPEGNIVLLDFGIAKALDHRGLYSTRVKGMGSPGFASPEQYSEELATDPRTDIYSLGATMYALLAGRPAPDGIARSQALLDGAADPLVPLGTVNEAVPPGVVSLVTRLMAVRRTQRHASAGEARSAIEAVRRQPDSVPPDAVHPPDDAVNTGKEYAAYIQNPPAKPA